MIADRRVVAAAVQRQVDDQQESQQPDGERLEVDVAEQGTQTELDGHGCSRLHQIWIRHGRRDPDGSCQDAAPSRVSIVVGPLRLIGLLVVAALALPATSPAATQRVLPPGNSGANQYTETLSGAGGNVPTSGIGGRGRTAPAKTLGPSNAGQLEAFGPPGRAAAQLAADTAPGRVGGRRGATRAANPSGASGLSQVLGQLSGSSGSGGMGLLLPLVIAAAAVGSLVYLWRRKQPKA